MRSRPASTCAWWGSGRPGLASVQVRGDAARLGLEVLLLDRRLVRIDRLGVALDGDRHRIVALGALRAARAAQARGLRRAAAQAGGAAGAPAHVDECGSGDDQQHDEDEHDFHDKSGTRAALVPERTGPSRAYNRRE